MLHKEHATRAAELEPEPPPKPRVFPGINGCPAEDIESFVCLDDLPIEWHHLVAGSREMAQVVHAATQLPTAETEEARSSLFTLMDHAVQSCENKIKTIEAIREWSESNLGLADPKRIALAKHRKEEEEKKKALLAKHHKEEEERGPGTKSHR